jgi:Xaa-Pro aminopeptidase
MAGMITSNEPGYYEDGNFGIRIENLMVTVPAATPNNFAGRKFCKFEPLTLVPIQADLMDLSLLTDAEIAWINAYHAQVREALLPQMREKFPEAVDFLVHATGPISK